MSSAPQKRTSNYAASESLERMRVLWLVSFLLLLVIVVMSAVFLAGYVRRLGETVSRQTDTIESLQSRATDAEQRLQELESRLAELRAAGRSEAAPTNRGGRLAPSNTPPQPTSEEARAAAQALLETNAEGVTTLRDPRAALELLKRTDRAAADGQLSGAALEDLGILATLLGDDARASALELQCTRAGWMPIRLYELSTRRLLAAGKLLEARAAAKRLAAAADAPPVAPVLVASIEFALGRYAFADEALARLPDPTQLAAADRLRMAHVLVGLERWSDARRAIDGLGPLPDSQQRVLNLVRAILAIQDGQYAVGLGILDHLLAATPDDYDLLTWRGIALLRAGQYQAAREALAVAQRDTSRPEAYYWLGVLEHAEGNAEAAEQALRRALAADAAFAPALEALGNVELQRDQLADAVGYLTKAIEADPHRASAHFLLAIAHARASNRLEAENALREALRLDPALLEKALRIEALTSLFSEDDLRTMTPRRE